MLCVTGIATKINSHSKLLFNAKTAVSPLAAPDSRRLYEVGGEHLVLCKS